MSRDLACDWIFIISTLKQILFQGAYDRINIGFRKISFILFIVLPSGCSRTNIQATFAVCQIVFSFDVVETREKIRFAAFPIKQSTKH